MGDKRLNLHEAAKHPEMFGDDRPVDSLNDETSSRFPYSKSVGKFSILGFMII